MTDNNDDRPDSSDEQQPGFTHRDFADDPSEAPRREPRFSGFDMEDDDAYEEPDRDTDHSSSYAEDRIEDDLFNDSPVEEDAAATDEVEDDFGQTASDTGAAAGWQAVTAAPALGQASLDGEQEQEQERVEDELPFDEPEDDYPEEDNYDDGDEEPREQDEWEDEDNYPEDDDVATQNWPPALIIVGVLALILLAAGGYGVIQQRSATQEEIRRLESELATTVNPAEVAASRDALRSAEAYNAELQASFETLTLENRRLTDTVAGLEAQLQAQQAALAKPATPQPATPQPATPKPKPKPVAKKAPAPSAKPAPASASGDWFVNFSSYTQREAAQSWAAKLRPAAGNVQISEFNKDGRTYYRVRVVGLGSREAAQKAAAQLEKSHGVSKLWIGKQ
jgi:cell division septation protein DedD